MSLALIALTAIHLTAMGQPSFQPLGFPIGAASGIKFNDASKDGRIAIATTLGATTAQRAAIWEDGTWALLEMTPGSTWCVANRISADGHVILGADAAGQGTAYGVRWIDRVPSRFYHSNFQPIDLSAVSRTGWYLAGTAGLGAVKWNPLDGFGGFSYYPDLLRTFRCTDINDQGFAVGYPGIVYAPVAIGIGGSIHIPPVGMPLVYANPFMNDAGTLIVSDGRMWNRVTDQVSLLDWRLESRDMTEDGEIVVGAVSERAVIWTRSQGTIQIPCLLDQLGLDHTGWTLTRADNVSDDGTVIFGKGVDPDGKQAAWRLYLPFMPATIDLDDGSGLGRPDGGVDINDLLYFLARFEAGSVSADLDNGDGHGERDGGVDVGDLLFFLTRFEMGC